MLRTTIRKTLRITSAARAPVVNLRATAEGLLVQSVSADVAVECRMPDIQAAESLAVPYSAFCQCEGRTDETVTVQQTGEAITVDWSDDGIPQSAQFDAPALKELPAIPPNMTESDTSLITALSEAVKTTDDYSTRYALSCVRLRGSDGQIAATDSRQALLQSGFTFPWNDEVLVHTTDVFGLKELQSANTVQIGRSDEWVTVRAGAWTVHLRIETGSRFPAVDDHVPAADAVTTTLNVTDDDAEFLIKALKRLPAAGEHDAPVTIDLNGSVVIRAKDESQPAPTDLMLSNSRRVGVEVRFNSNRNLLARAVGLGFRDIELRGAEAPAVCRNDRMTYLWALLGKEAALQPVEHATRIESPVATTRPTTGTTPIMKKTTPRTSPTVTATDDTPGILDQAETLRDALKTALCGARELITALKQKEKASRSVQSALKSLRQLESLEV